VDHRRYRHRRLRVLAAGLALLERLGLEAGRGHRRAPHRLVALTAGGVVWTSQKARRMEPPKI
jgi:hypothetical protein